MADLLGDFGSGAATPEEVAAELTAAAEEAGARFRHIAAMDANEVRRRARSSTQRWRSGAPRPLEGIPLALKGSVCDSTGMPAAEDSPLLRRLETCGAIVQCVVVPTGWGTPSAPPPDRVPLNPWDGERIPGGSSTGSAIALAAGHVPIAIGSDAAGSIRIPAAFCNVVGLKPTHGAVPGGGGPQLSPTLGEIGPMARTVADVAALFAAIGPAAGSAPDDASRRRSRRTSRRVGVLEWDLDTPHDDARGAYRDALQTLEALGAELVPLAPRHLGPARAAGWTVLCYEAASESAPHIDDLRRSPTSFLRYAERGRLILRDDYRTALGIGAELARELDALLSDLDAIATPCAPSAPPRHDDPDVRERTAAVGEAFLPFNLSGHPALVLPIAPVCGAPAGMQLVGRPGGEHVLFDIGNAFQSATDYHLRVPLPTRNAGRGALPARHPPGRRICGPPV